MSFELDGVDLCHPGGHVALRGITLAARQGESLALIGPSGAGKTTLLNLLGTALPASAGRVHVLGSALGASSPDTPHASWPPPRALRARIGTVHQAPPLPPRQRVVTAVLAGRLGQWAAWKALASLLYPADLPGAHAALQRVQLQDKLFARCDQLSGGQLQRVGIARVLYQQPALLLADEPVSALDPTLALATVQLLVQDAAARGATLVASLHAVDLALACFARVVGLREGRIAFDLPAGAVTPDLLQALYAPPGDGALAPDETPTPPPTTSSYASCR
ncbi:ATP-binding cassette domain-containing protein [Diaphorobacter sp.]|uniref:phosphonate ABC transporter ATP-binding protein n=1 Tax=Diaphorobacter sp. TaxID=1934310 RepID=UPI002590D4E7|nr:ATP-binding cassette domain-containing protein [Diaphorobacter sp.]